jgi:hypothetical protein
VVVVLVAVVGARGRAVCAAGRLRVCSPTTRACCCRAQVLQHIPPRKAPTDAGAGHCGAVLCVAAAVRGGEQLMASAAHEPDCAVKIWSSADEMQG